MPFSRRILFALVLLTPLVAAGCNDNKTPTSPSTNPQIIAVSPIALQPSAAPQVLTITGDHFLSGLTLQVRNPAGVTTAVSGASVQITNSSSFTASVLLDVTGTYTFTVRNANGDQSGTFLVVVRSITPTTPSLSAVTPSGVPRSSQPVLLNFVGTNLGPQLTFTVVDPAGVVVNLTSGAITAATSTSVQLQLVLNTVGTYAFAVSSPLGEVSNYVYVSVN
jgi:hypothetical protein